jgi:hypothetical protein
MIVHHSAMRQAIEDEIEYQHMRYSLARLKVEAGRVAFFHSILSDAMPPADIQQTVSNNPSTGQLVDRRV